MAVTGIFAYEDQKQIKIKSRSRSKASRLKAVLQSEPIPQAARAAVSGTGFSREGAGLGTVNLAVLCLIVPTLRVVVTGLFAHEDQKQIKIKSFPAEAGPTVRANPTGCTRCC
ncbi:hypothetical protein AO263_22960 [Pseudomonas sp. NZIPFR-PS5]|nr:hypothetical protein AO263_22960 [Pseudomonas sp. NZIPFR-PS5]